MPGTENRVFVADTILSGIGGIYSATTGNMTFALIPIDNIGNPISVTFDPIEDMVYWSDQRNRYIARASTNGGSFEIVVNGVNSKSLNE